MKSMIILICGTLEWLFFAHQADAEDVVQNAFTKLFDNFEEGKHINVVKGYLYKTIRNKCINLIKYEKANQTKWKD